MKNNLNKIKTISSLKKLIIKHKKQKKKIVLCHGTFDILHIGHLNYFKAAKKNGDILIVSVTSEKYVNKGPTRPIHNDLDRITALSYIDIIDFVVLDFNQNSTKIISEIKPDFYVKGKDYYKANDKNLSRERIATKKYGGRIIFTDEKLYSSSRIINQTSIPDDIKKEVKNIKKIFDLDKINNLLNEFKKFKILLIGEAIEDEYIYTDFLGKPSKENIIATIYKSMTRSFGGIFGTYKALKALDIKADCLTVVNKNSKKILKKIDKSLLKSKTVFVSEKENIRKTRFINKSHYKINKLFEIYNNNDLNIEFTVKNKIKKFLTSKINNYDLIIINDYGHGLIDKEILNLISRTKKKLCVNAQINAGNFGYNLITKYKKADFVCLNKNEAQSAIQDNTNNYEKILNKLKNRVKCDSWCITLGSGGSIIKYKKEKLFKLNAFSNQILDTISAGDIFYAIASVFWFGTKSKKMTLLVANLAGLIAANVESPSTFIDSKNFKKQIENIFK